MITVSMQAGNLHPTGVLEVDRGAGLEVMTPGYPCTVPRGRRCWAVVTWLSEGTLKEVLG